MTGFMLAKLSGRVAVITGASSGLGRAIALAFGTEGARLALVARDRDRLEQTAEQVRNLGVEADLFSTDVKEESQVQKLQAPVTAKFATVQILEPNSKLFEQDA